MATQTPDIMAELLSPEPSSSKRGHGSIRLALLFLTACGVAYASISFPSAKSRKAGQKTYRQTLVGETLSNAFLNKRAQRFDDLDQDPCDIETTLAIALIELTLADSALAKGKSEQADAHLRRASSKTRERLACTPTDGFAWFVAFWSDFLSGNLTQSSWRYIDASYRFAPHDAWVALIRLPLLARIWSIVPDARRRLMLDDFEMLMNAGFISQCARIFAFASEDQRADLRRLLTKVSESGKQQFERYLGPYDMDSIATGKGKREAEGLRRNLEGLADALGTGDGH
jgi:hypothetical protein